MKKTATLLVLVLGLAIGASLHLGLNLYSPAKVLAALGGAEGTDAIIIRTLRIPRTLVAICAGAALGLSGFLVQSATRNPLAEPGLLGINAGAAFCVVLGVTFWGTVGLAAMGALALAGGLSTTGFLFAVVAAAGRTAGPGTTLLAGVTLAAMLASLTQVLLLVDETALETMLFWLSGGFADRSFAVLSLGLPSLVVGMIGALAISGSLDVLRLDDDSAGALGVHVTGVRMGALALGALLAAGAVAMAGPVMFLGLVAPHLARRIAPRAKSAGWIVVTVLTGAIIAVLADIVARLIVLPGEAPVGAVLALVGVPILVRFLRRKAEAAL